MFKTKLHKKLYNICKTKHHEKRRINATGNF